MGGKGIFITFEGTEGSGKTTQAVLLAEFMAQQGWEVISTREPGGTDFGCGLREILLTGGTDNISALVEVFLYCADRVQHIQTMIRPALEEGKCVICDRFTDATIAYQGWGRELDLEEVEMACCLAGDGLIPDLTILLDIDPKYGLARAVERNHQRLSREDRYEKETLVFHRRVRDGYLAMAGANPNRVRVISGEGSAQEIHRKVVDVVKSLL